MTLGEKLSRLRKENQYTQEQLAEILGVSRQAISKWESNLAYPETDKLIRLGELFDCSLDYLLREQEEAARRNSCSRESTPGLSRSCERKSKKTVWGMPLWHTGRNARGFFAVGLNASGVFAVGLRAKGIVSLGVLSVGVASLGIVSLGAFSLGLWALGILSAGCISAGVLATGAISFGIISLGAIAVGDFSVGALAVGKYFAIGDNARAMIALADTQATGSVLEKIGKLPPKDLAAVKETLDGIVPRSLSWAKEIMKLFL